PFINFDPIALNVAKYCINRKWDEELHPIQRSFIYLVWYFFCYNLKYLNIFCSNFKNIKFYCYSHLNILKIWEIKKLAYKRTSGMLTLLLRYFKNQTNNINKFLFIP